MLIITNPQLAPAVTASSHAVAGQVYAIGKLNRVRLLAATATIRYLPLNARQKMLTRMTLSLLTFIVFSHRFALAEDPLQLRVLSYNIHHAEGVDRKLDVPRIADVMRSVKPDIIAVQEVDRKVKRSRAEDQPAELARLLSMHSAFGENIELQGGHYGNLLLSRFRIVRHKNHLLPNIDKSEQRGVIEAELQIADGKKPLLFFATHFDFRADERERLASVKMIDELAAARMDLPALLAGDLNATPESKTLQDLAISWTTANDQPLPTIPVDKPTQQIDFILYRPRERWNVSEVRVLDEAKASDHRAIFAVLELLPAK